MYRKFVSTTAAFLLGPMLLGCSHWVVTNKSLETIVDRDNHLRIGTADVSEFHLGDVSVTADSLFGTVTTYNYKNHGVESERLSRVSIARSDISVVKVKRTNWPASIGLFVVTSTTVLAALIAASFLAGGYD